MVNGQCVSSWVATGRYVYVVSDIPFVNLDSEIVTLMHVQIKSGDPRTLAQQLINEENIGQISSKAEFYDDAEYPLLVEYADPGLSGWQVLWRQNRDYEGSSYDWYRRDVFLRASGNRVFHLEMYSIDRLDTPEFDAMIGSLREGVSPDGAPDCTCRDEHDPLGGIQDC